MSNTRKSNNRLCKGRGHKFFWGITLVAAVLILYSIITGCTPHIGNSYSYTGKHGDHAPEVSQQKMDRRTEWALIKLGATDEQRASVIAVLDELTTEMARFQSARADLANQFNKAFEADQVSREELSRIQTAGLELAEQASSRMLESVIEASELLTPDQRKKAVNIWRRWQ